MLRLTAPSSVKPTSPIGPQPLYVFFDEAGNLDFGPSGTKYFLCGVMVTYDPWPLMKALTNLREAFFRGDFIPPAFHAAEDKQHVRDAVFGAIVLVGGFNAHIFVTNKELVPLKYRTPSAFYSFMADFALRMVLQRHSSDEPVFVITDVLPVRNKREAVVKGFKASLAAVLPNREFRIEHHSSGSQGCLQVIDYVNWAVFRRLERLDSGSYIQIKDYIVQEVQFDWTLVQ